MCIYLLKPKFMKSKITYVKKYRNIKRFAGIMAFLMLATQISIPVYAIEGEASDNGDPTVISTGTTNSVDKGVADDFELPPNTSESNSADSVSGSSQKEQVSLSEDVDVENVVGVILGDLEELSDSAGETLVGEAVDGVVESLEGESDSEAEDALADLEANIQSAMDKLNSDVNVDAEVKAKILKKILHLKAMYVRIKAKLLKKHATLITKLARVKEMPKVYEFRWGNLTGQRARCTGVSLKNLRDSLSSGKIPEKCRDSANEVKYTGKISVDKGTLKVYKNVLFEEGDKVTDDSGTSIKFTSKIAGHWDGLIVEYIPDDKQDTKVNITLSIGELDKTYVGPEVFGRKKIGNNHMVEIKPIARVMQGLAKGAQNKLIKNKLNLQTRITNIRAKLDRLRLMNKGGDGADEIDNLLNEAGEYNFDDETATEVETTIASVANNLSDGSTADEIRNRAVMFKAKLAALKKQAINKKFLTKMIPFKDTDDNQWYTNYVSAVKNRGIINGYKDAAGNELGEYRPGNNITVAEILKIGLETSEKGKAVGKLPNMVSAMNHWAKEYVAQAEELGLNLVEGDVDLNRPATRAEVVRMMLEALGIEPDTISKTSFSDLPKLHKHAAFIEYAKELGIISGDAGATTFRPDAPINRAEAAKIANQILTIIIGGWDS